MGTKGYAPFYKVTEEIYREGYFEGKRPLIRDTDFCVDEPTIARAEAFGFVAERMLALAQLRNEKASPSEQLEAFSIWNISTNSDEEAETVVEKIGIAADGNSLDYFDKSDNIVWRVEVIAGNDFSDCFLVFDSGDDATEAVDRLLQEAMFLSEYAKVQLATN